MSNNLDTITTIPDDLENIDITTARVLSRTILANSECMLFDFVGDRTFDIEKADYLALPNKTAIHDLEKIIEIYKNCDVAVPMFCYAHGGFFMVDDSGDDAEWKWVSRLSRLKKMLSFDFNIKE